MSAEDVFLTFLDTARRMLCESFQTELERDYDVGKSRFEGPSWSWLCTRILTSCKTYPTGITSAILLSDLYESWLERSRIDRFLRNKGRNGTNTTNNDTFQLRKEKQVLGSKVTTIDSILERNFVALDAVLDVVIVEVKVLPGSSTFVMTLGDAWSFNTVEFYLHSKFYDLVGDDHSIFRKGREIRLTGCRLRNQLSLGSHPPPRLLPTEFVIILLDDDNEDDLILLGAKFCTDYFSCIQLENIKAGVDYYFYARVEEIEPMETQQAQDIKQQRITLRDDNGDFMPLILWNEQVSLSKLLSKGSMVAMERPAVVYEVGSDSCSVSGLWLEYESHTRLYTIPCVDMGDQVLNMAQFKDFVLFRGSMLHMIQLWC